MDGNEIFKCIYCQLTTRDFGEIIDHNIINHGDVLLKIRIVNTFKTATQEKTKNYNIISNEILRNGKIIIPNKETMTLKISRLPEENDPFLHFQENKRYKLEPPLETDMSERATEFLFNQIQDLPTPQSDLQDEQEENVMETHGEHFLDTDNSTELYELLPAVIQTLKNEGEMDSYVKFNRLVAGNKLPLKNIAFLLFKDVVSWYSLDDSHKMRYSPEVKQFWRIGLKLFKGRFLRFMSGMKNQGQDIQRHLNPEDSAINFAVPDRKSLDGSDISETLKNLTPRIFHEMIDMLHEHDQDQLQTYKICFDGKKLNAGVDGQKSGDINLWGYEGPPSLQKVENMYENDLKCISSLERAISTLDIRHITDLAYVPESCKDGITETGKNVLTVISERLSALRKVKQKKEISLEKIKKICTTPEMNAKYSYAISAIRTFIYRIGACIDRLLNLVDTLGYALSVINDVSFLYCRGKICYLSEQQNYVCITGIQNNTIKRDDVSSLDTTFVKQKSTAWKTIRSFAKVTGSTCFDALGLGGLKKQKEHFEYVFSGKEKTEPSPEVKKYMQHGTVNEINCVATLVSKVLPVFYPSQSYFEEGCKVDYLDNNFMLLVSPDGSLRSSCEFGGKKPCFAVEIKCPYPGNVYKPKVYYELPHYYVPQILSEMSVLETNCIIFLCYSLESTIVFEADFDSMLWDQIMSRLIQCYGKADSKCPTKLPSDLKEFQEKMKQYCKDNVRLIAEVPSVVAKTCGHDVVSSDKNDAKYNQHKSLQQISAESCTVSNLNKTVYEIMETVKEAYGLTRHIATEVVVYLISDLNRSHIPERQHSVPIGYAMKGYSMTTDVMRNMVNDILEKCYHGGLYVPVISFDGQWYTIAVRSANNEPLTILQLMKDVYKQARSIKKSDMLKHMKQINLVPKLSNREEVFELIENQVEDKITILNGKEVKTTIYTLLKKKETPYLLHTSSTVAALLFNNSTVENKEITEEHENSRTEFLDNLPENIAPLIENDILEQVTNEQDISSHQVDNMFHTDISAELRTIFQDDDSHLLLNEASAIQRHIENNSRNDESVENSNQSPENQEKRTIEDEEFIKMLSALQTDSKVKKKKWESISLSEFKTIFQSIEEIRKNFYRVEIQVCLISITDFLKAQHIRFAVSWTKYKLSDLMFNIVNQPEVLMTRSRSMKKLYCLKTLCLMSISKFPKDVLNIVYAEHIYPTEELKWRNNMPFDESTHIEGMNTNIQWYSKPEYVSNRFMHLFSLLDCHHLLTNARIKCCSTGIVEAGIHSNAWSKVARQTSKDGKEIISSALVDDLIDKQRNVYAQKTFSNEVETAMTENGDLEEAIFCKLIREWYQAEDEPGIAALERCERRLNLRTWLMDKIDIGKFPPPGRHVKGIPIVMFEGLMTNIERRIQLFPFIKSGAYNVRALGSLESENFFGQFQDLDPKGSGVLRPDDVSTAISTACELTQARFDPNRVFYMNTSRAKVYPVKELETNSEHLDTRNYVSPHQVNMINTRDHMFDLSERGKRQHPKRKSGEISRPGMPSRGIKPVREHHHCDETKILPHVRMGLSVNEINQ